MIQADSAVESVAPVPADPPAGLVRTLVAAVRSALTFVLVSLYVFICAPIGMLLAMAFGWKVHLYVLGHIGVQLGMTLAGIRCRVAGREHVPQGRAVVFCSNHQSNVDPPLLFRVLHPRLHIFFKAELKKLPLLGRAFGYGGFVAVDRRNREQSLAAIEQASASVRAGNSFLIFPEGTRSRTGDLLPFKKGGFVMAIKAEAPVVPVAVQGGRAAMRRGSALIWPTMVSVRIGEPVETTGLKVEDRDGVVREVRSRIEALLAQGPVV